MSESLNHSKTLIHLGNKQLTVSLNHLLNQFIQNTDSVRNKTRDCIVKDITKN